VQIVQRGAQICRHGADTPNGMMWFYERGGEHLSCEMRMILDGDGYELVVKWPNGHEHTEHYRDQGRLLRRWCELDRAWEAQGWTELNNLLDRKPATME
jgi:hypothetical protein